MDVYGPYPTHDDAREGIKQALAHAIARGLGILDRGTGEEPVFVDEKDLADGIEFVEEGEE